LPWVSGFVDFRSYLMLSSVLHPQHKLQYFKNARWTDEWIEAAKALVREEFERSYASMDADILADIGPTLVKVSTAILNCDG
jgi:hypothetical protein